jgi:hypothetical protein
MVGFNIPLARWESNWDDWMDRWVTAVCSAGPSGWLRPLTLVCGC